tara:strand:+ start:368 stop:559 length:192 start_codon:yes stop_codon:yes gene_type:complete
MQVEQEIHLQLLHLKETLVAQLPLFLFQVIQNNILLQVVVELLQQVQTHNLVQELVEQEQVQV